MNALVFALITTASVLSCVSRSAAQDIPEVLQGMRLLPDYRLQPLQGMDSIVGQISKPDGLTIRYEIGRIPKPRKALERGGGQSCGTRRDDHGFASPADLLDGGPKRWADAGSLGLYLSQSRE